jgi:hypothetical protein
MRKALVWVLVVAAAYAVSCGSSSSSSSAPPPTPPLSGTIGGHAFTPVETMALNFGSDGSPCLLHINPMDPSAVTTVGVKAVVMEAATYAGTCDDLLSSQCRFHASSQKVTMLVARVNLVPPGTEPALTPGTYTVSADLAHPTVDSAGAYVAFAQTIAVDPSFAASTGTSVAGGTIQLTDVAGPVTGTVSLTFTDGSSVSGTFSAPFCSGATDACGLAGTLAAALAGGGTQGLCTLPPAHVP